MKFGGLETRVSEMAHCDLEAFDDLKTKMMYSAWVLEMLVLLQLGMKSFLLEQYNYRRMMGQCLRV